MTSEYPNAGVVTCFLETPTNGFITEPFAIGDEVFAEGILRVERQEGVVSGITTNTTVTGDGFNSENHNYKFFDVQDYIVELITISVYLAGLTTNPALQKILVRYATTNKTLSRYKTNSKKRWIYSQRTIKCRKPKNWSYCGWN